MDKRIVIVGAGMTFNLNFNDFARPTAKPTKTKRKKPTR